MPPDQPSDESFKLAESLIIIEFIADLFPASGLLPSDPIERAKVRFVVDTAATKVQPAYLNFLRHGSDTDALIAALKEVQSLLPSGAQVAVGNKFTIADAALVPWLWRIELSLEGNVGKFTEADKKRVLDAYEGESLRTLREYFSAIKSRKNFKQSTQAKVSGHHNINWRLVNPEADLLFDGFKGGHRGVLHIGA